VQEVCWQLMHGRPAVMKHLAAAIIAEAVSLCNGSMVCTPQQDYLLQHCHGCMFKFVSD